MFIKDDYIKFGWKSIGFTNDNQLEILCGVDKFEGMNVIRYRYFNLNGECVSGIETVSVDKINMFIDMKKELGI